jgi:hypothetical protein
MADCGGLWLQVEDQGAAYQTEAEARMRIHDRRELSAPSALNSLELEFVNF